MATCVENVVQSHSLSTAELVKLLHDLQGTNTKTCAMTGKLVKMTKRQTSKINYIAKQSRTQVLNVSSVKRYLTHWTGKVAQYCKEILSMVERNTAILLSLHGMMVKMEMLLAKGIDLPILQFENPFGIKMALPYHLCETWDVSPELCSMSRALNSLVRDFIGYSL